MGRDYANTPTTRKAVRMADNEMVFQEAELLDTTTGEVMPISSIKAVDTMTALEFEQWLNQEGAGIVAFDGGSQWTLVGDKHSLIGQDFVIANMRFNTLAAGQSGDFVSVMAFKVPTGEKIVFNDGSTTGVYAQLKQYQEKGRTTGIRCKDGLRVSAYTYTDPATGQDRPAETFYIA